jgi:hypothetical protein
VCGPELDISDHSTEFVDALSWRWMAADNAAAPASASLDTVPWPRSIENWPGPHPLTVTQCDSVLRVQFWRAVDAQARGRAIEIQGISHAARLYTVAVELVEDRVILIEPLSTSRVVLRRS